MATGIFVIGRNLSLEGYLDISRKFGVRTRMQFYKPIEVGLPLYLNNPEKYYCEGILVCTKLGQSGNEDLIKAVKDSVLGMGKDIEELYSQYSAEGRAWDSKLRASQLFITGVVQGEPGVKPIPYVEIIEFCPDVGLYARCSYAKIAEDLISRTRDVRIKRFIENQDIRAKEATKVAFEETSIDSD